MKYYVGYYRVSTQKQGESGLSLEAQREAVRNYVASKKGELLGEFQEVASGGRTDREVLAQAIDHAREHGAALVVKRLDRLSRDGFRVSLMLDDMGIKYIDCDSPNDSELVKNIKLAIAKEEKQKISQRIKDSMSTIKANIEKNGHHVSRAGNVITKLGHEATLGSEEAHRKASEAKRAKRINNPNNKKAIAVIRMMRDSGNSFQAICDFLNSNGFKSSRGGEFSRFRVRNMYEQALN